MSKIRESLGAIQIRRQQAAQAELSVEFMANRASDADYKSDNDSSVHVSADKKTDSLNIPMAVLNEVADEAAKLKRETNLAKIYELNMIYFVSIEGGNTSVFKEGHDPELNRPQITSISVASFKALFANQWVEVPCGKGGSDTRAIQMGNFWLTHPERRTFTGGLAMIPKGVCPSDVMNLFQGLGGEPDMKATVQDVREGLEFFQNIVSARNHTSYKYLMGWLARGVQYPELQAETAIVLLGGKGIGKGFFGRMVGDLFGAHSMHILHSRHLTGNFNAHLRNLLFMFVDESFFAGDRAANNVLKGLITEPTIAIEKKSVDVVTVKNRLKIVMATNEEHAIRASGDERRFAVYRVSEERKQDHDYFDKLDRWWTSGGKEKLLGFLLNLELSNFNIRKIPNTAALEDQKIKSLEPFDEWLFERLMYGPWKTEVSCSEFAGAFYLHVQSRRDLKYVKTSVQAVGASLRARLTTKTVQETSGARRRMWILPEQQVAREQFAGSLGLVLTSWEGE